MSAAFSSSWPEEMVQTMIEMSRGNPGALTTLIELSRQCSPDELGTVLSTLHANQIAGSHIWIIWKYHCGFNMDRFLSFPFDSYIVPVDDDEE